MTEWDVNLIKRKRSKETGRTIDCRIKRGRYSSLCRLWKWQNSRRGGKLKISAMYRRMQALFPRTMRQCYHHVSEIKKILRNHSLRDSHYAIFFSDTSSFICNTCSSSSWSCFICHNGITDPSEPDTEIIKCDFNNCGRHYHRIGSIVAEILAEKRKKFWTKKSENVYHFINSRRKSVKKVSNVLIIHATRVPLNLWQRKSVHVKLINPK